MSWFRGIISPTNAMRIADIRGPHQAYDKCGSEDERRREDAEKRAGHHHQGAHRVDRSHNAQQGALADVVAATPIMGDSSVPR